MFCWGNMIKRKAPSNRIHSWRRKWRRSPPGKVDMPYRRKQGLLSQGELAFYRVLRRALNGRCGVSLKTRLADIIHCPTELWETSHGRRLAQKHVDFVLYDWETAEIRAVIELDDRSHREPERRRRDRFLDKALASVDVRLLRVPAAATYDVEILTARIHQALFKQPKRQDSTIVH
jgi:very-short-patch-repair endonuclease